MSRLTKSERLLKNAEAALISAIEVYNKPTFAYREETFSILALNAWELLLKAKLLSVKKNDPRCLYIYAPRQLAPGRMSTKQYRKRNRTGNIMTVGIDACVAKLEAEKVVVPDPVKKNLSALVEIRDNSIHFINASARLSKQVLEIGTACVRNFVELGQQWLNLDLSSYGLYLMPIGFLPSTAGATAIALSPDEQRVVNYLATLTKQGNAAENQDYHVSLDVNISFRRVPSSAANAIIVANAPSDPNAIPVHVSEEHIRRQYPWDYSELTEKLMHRYIDFKQNKKYHEARKRICTNPQHVKTRFLDPDNPRGPKKDFFNPNVVAEFDKVYTRRK